MSTYRNSALVIDRCNRLVYQLPINQDDADLEPLAAILSADDQEPCGPCQVTDDTRSSTIGVPEVLDDGIIKGISAHGQSDLVKKTERIPVDFDYVNLDILRSGLDPHTTIADVTPVAVADDVQPQEIDRDVGTTDDNKEDIDVDVDPTKKPDRKKNKNKRKKVRKQKQKKRKRVQGNTTTAQPTEEDLQECRCRIDENEKFDVDSVTGVSDGKIEKRCPCTSSVEPSGHADHTHNADGWKVHHRDTVDESSLVDHLAQHDEELAMIIQQLMKFLHKQRDLESTTPIVPPDGGLSPVDTQDFQHRKRNRDKPRNTKQEQRNRKQDIDEGIKMVTEDEEFVEYPDKIDAFVRTEDEIMAQVDNLDRNLLGHGVGSYQVNQQREVLDLTFTTSDEKDVENMMTDILTDRFSDNDHDVPPAEVYVTGPGEFNTQARREHEDEDQVWGTYKEEETITDYDTKKSQTKMKDTAKKGKKIEGEYKKGGRIGKKHMQEASDERDFARRWEEEERGTSEDSVKQPDERRDPWTPRNRLATWKEVTLSPQPDSSEGQHRRLVLYASDYETPSAEEQPFSDKVTLLHTKLHPTKHNKN